MTLLLDTNVVLDMLLERESFVEDAARLFQVVEQGVYRGFLAPTSVTTVHYLVSKALDAKEADRIIASLLKLFDIVPVNKTILLQAVEDGGIDFEDSVIYAAAAAYGIDAIVTRDTQGFAHAALPIWTPRRFVQRYLSE